MKKSLTVEGIITEAEKRRCSISQVVIELEENVMETPVEVLRQRMREYWQVMSEAINTGIESKVSSLSGLVGEEGTLLAKYIKAGKALSGDSTAMASARAMAVAVVNSSMGKIVAAPTAGSCGILPGVLLTVAEKTSADEEKIIQALFAAAGIGMVIDENASTSGAEGGCQAECGAAACMAAVAAVELAGGTPRQAAHAGAIALKNIMGLVCDPVAGLVEIPCVKRNAMGAANALLAADIALAGIDSKIPIDEVIGSLKEVGDMLPTALKETAQGGLANTPTAREIEANLSKL